MRRKRWNYVDIYDKGLPFCSSPNFYYAIIYRRGVTYQPHVSFDAANY